MKVYASRGSARTVALASNKYVLTFRSVDPSGPVDRRATVVVELLHRNDFDQSRYDTGMECFGCLGLVNAAEDVFLCVIVDRSKAAMPTPGRTVWNIHAVEFIKLRYDPLEVDEQEGPCDALKKFIDMGGFLYSADFDLTSRAVGGKVNVSSTPLDPSFMWNQFMIKGLNQFRDSLSFEDQTKIAGEGFATTLIRGFASSTPIQLDNLSGILTVISRQSWLRAGTRYNSRGIDDNGNVANFVESETVLWLKNGVQFGFLQLRGSVPLFWEQDPQLLTAKINFTRPVEATEPSFRKHFESLVDRFGAVHCVDLLGSPFGSRGSAIGKASNERGLDLTESIPESGVGPASEADVSMRYQGLAAKIAQLRYTHFDFHKEVSGIGYSAASKLIDRIQDSMLEFGFYSFDPANEASGTEQIGVFRVNCLDCLDRTNLVQQLISKDALDLFLDYYEIFGNDDLWNAHATLWADNGDQLSQNYTGTGALKSSYTRSGRMNLAGALSDVSKSVGRLYINNFVDKSRQMAIEELLGKAAGQVAVRIFDPINDHVREEMKHHADEFQSQSSVSVFAGTFNLNGKMVDKGLEAWLFPKHVTESGQYPDLYVISFQELVELTASQVLNVDPSRRTYWETTISHCLNSRSEQYVLLRSGQLVGTAIMLFVKKSKMNEVTEVEGASKKTALSGITGNKGGVAIGFKYANTRFMVINSHMAAGMHNTEERHNDYKLLSSGLRLSENRRMKDADIVLWCGDLNYRINLPNDTVRKIIDQDKPDSIQKLLEHDQLTKQMERGETFPYFNEQKITFYPTYKFDPGTSTYDTSDKQRVPAWTDRILVKGPRIKNMGYSSVPQIRFSDHRPVYALYQITVSVLDKARADAIYSQLYDKHREVLMTNENGMLFDEHYQYPSTDTQKWWAGPGMQTKIPVQPPQPNMLLNPNRVNPFGSKEPEFIPRPPVPSPRAVSPAVSVQTQSSSNSSHQPPPAPPSRNSSSSSSRKPVSTLQPQSSSSSLMDAPIQPSVPPPRASNKTSSDASLMDSNDGTSIGFKSLI